MTARLSDVLAFLRSRPEVAGINNYRNNDVIHIDYNERFKVTRQSGR